MEDIDEAALLKEYGLDSLEPQVWTNVDHESHGGQNSAFLADEPDPLGLRGILPKQSDKNIATLIHLSSKAFDPKIFLSTMHPDATFADLNAGNLFLKQSIEQRSEALKILVETNFDKFVAVKATTDGVYREMRDSKEGPLRSENDHGIKKLKEILANASAKADQVFMPVLENNLKAAKLRSTLGVFERSRFFFNLPGSLGEAIEVGKYDQALRDYKRGKYLMTSKPGQLLAISQSTQDLSNATDQRQAQQRRIFAKVWDAVESVMKEMRETLLLQLQEPKKSVEEQEKTIELLLEMELDQDPIAVFLESQRNHMKNLMQKAFENGIAKVEAAASVDALVNRGETEKAKDLQACIQQLSQFEHSYERMIGTPGWKAIFDLVKQVTETLVQTLPSFCKVLSDGKLKAKEGIKLQARAWAKESVELYVDSLSSFFRLTDVALLAKKDLSPLPSWVPQSCSLTASHYLKAILNELSEALNELQTLKVGETQEILKNFYSNICFNFVEVLCQLWQEDAKIIYRLETWTMDGEITLFLRDITAFQSSNAASAFQLVKSNEGGARVKATFVDAIYVYLDGLVHLAFSEFNPLDENLNETKDLDTRVLLGVTNLDHFIKFIVPTMAKSFTTQFHTRMKDDLHTIEEVASELDKILFDNFADRKGTFVAEIFRKGISEIDWKNVEKPKEVQPYIFEALLAMVQVHAQVRSVAKPLVGRTIRALLEQIANAVLESFEKISSFGMGGMLQATLEIEFVHQTLAIYVSENAELTLKKVYETISKKYSRGEEDDQLQAELDNVKRVLVASRKASALEFLCFRKPRDTSVTSTLDIKDSNRSRKVV